MSMIETVSGGIILAIVSDITSDPLTVGNVMKYSTTDNG